MDSEIDFLEEEVDELPPEVSLPMPNGFALRDYQLRCLQAIKEAWQNYSRVLVVMPTGTGKTVVFAKAIKDEIEAGGRVLLIAHTDFLLQQAAEKLESAGVECEREKGDEHASLSSHVVVASIQTISKDARLMGFPDDHFSLVVVDECFTGETLIDGIRIKDVKVGDKVRSYNHTNKEIEYRAVTRVFKKSATKLLAIKIGQGKRVVCSEDHPFFTNAGYVAAKTLKAGDLLYEKMDMLSMRKRRDEERELFSVKPMFLRAMQEIQKEGAQEKKTESMQAMRSNSRVFRKKSVPQKSSIHNRGKDVLFDPMPGQFHETRERTSQAALDCLEQEVLQPEDARKQPYERSEERRKNGCRDEGEDFPESWRKWRANKAAEGDGRSIEVRYGISYRNPSSKESFSVVTELLQGRSRVPISQTCDRDRWSDPSIKEMEVSGCKENSGLGTTRVESIEILERGCGQRYSEMCPDGFIYNIEVEGNNNYFANGILVHNCHRQLAFSYIKVCSYFHFGEQSLDEAWVMPEPGFPFKHKARCCGFTATSDRGDRRSLGEFYQHCCFDYGLIDACKDGYLVRPIVKNIPLKIDLKGVRISRSQGGADFDKMEVAARLTPLLRELAEQIAKEAIDRKVIVFVPSVDSAQRMAEAAAEVGFRSSFVSGACQDQDAKIKAFKAAGPGTLIVNAMLLIEGFDAPDVSCICVLRPTKIRSLYVQCCGRGSRPLTGTLDGLNTREKRLAAIAASGKKDMLILDPLWLSDRLDLIHPIDLVATRAEVRQKMSEAIESGATTDLLNLEATATRDLMKSLEAAARKHANKQARVIDPLSWAVSLGDAALANWEPSTIWDELAATEPQLDFIRKQHIDTTHIVFRGHAQKIIVRLLARMKLHLAPVVQLNFMRQLGVPEEIANTLTKDEASKVINKILADKKARRAVPA